MSVPEIIVVHDVSPPEIISVQTILRSYYAVSTPEIIIISVVAVPEIISVLCLF